MAPPHAAERKGHGRAVDDVRGDVVPRLRVSHGVRQIGVIKPNDLPPRRIEAVPLQHFRRQLRGIPRTDNGHARVRRRTVLSPPLLIVVAAAGGDQKHRQQKQPCSQRRCLNPAQIQHRSVHDHCSRHPSLVVPGQKAGNLPFPAAVRRKAEDDRLLSSWCDEDHRPVLVMADSLPIVAGHRSWRLVIARGALGDVQIDTREQVVGEPPIDHGPPGHEFVWDFAPVSDQESDRPTSRDPERRRREEEFVHLDDKLGRVGSCTRSRLLAVWVGPRSRGVAASHERRREHHDPGAAERWNAHKQIMNPSKSRKHPYSGRP